MRRAAVRRLAAPAHARGAHERRGVRHVAVRQGRRGGPRPAQARRAGGADAVGHGACGERDGTGHGGADRPGAGAAGGPGDLRADPFDRDAGLLPDRVAGAARPRRAAPAGDVPRSRCRHIAVQARSRRGRHGAALHRRQARAAGAALPPSRPGAGAARDARRGDLPRAGHRRPVHDDRLRPGAGGRGAAGPVRSGAPGAGARLVRRRGGRARLSAGGRRPHLGDPGVVRQLRLLQGARRRLRRPDLPVRLAQGAPSGRLLCRAAHARSGHVPQAAAARRRAAARGAGAAAGRQPVRRGLQNRTGV